ncbi:MAG: hypothetical protein HOO89_02225 [Ferruginibacter sp.]|nr:hypothetical protein [Ferruginibacter sp.]
MTRDKDFCDLAFFLKIPMTGFVLLRYNPTDEEEIVSKLFSFLENENILTITGKFKNHYSK